jgi:hypothetical protein
VVSNSEVKVLVAQAEFKTDINPSNVAVASGGGLIPGLIAASQNSSRTKKAEKAIAPIRTALVDFDVDALAIDTTKAALAQVPWMKPAAVSFSKDASPSGRSGMLDKSAGQVTFVEYSYDFSPDFSTMRLVAKIEVADKASSAATRGRPEARVSNKNLAYAQRATAIIWLSQPGEKIENAQRWAAAEGKAAREGLIKAFGNIQKLLPRTLALSDADVQRMADKRNPKSEAGGFAGRVQASSQPGTLLWSDGFIHAEVLR